MLLCFSRACNCLKKKRHAKLMTKNYDGNDKLIYGTFQETPIMLIFSNVHNIPAMQNTVHHPLFRSLRPKELNVNVGYWRCGGCMQHLSGYHYTYPVDTIF